MEWILPKGASTFAGDIDFLYYLILVITGIAFVVVEVGILWFAIRYRARPGRRARYTHGSLRAEFVWTAVPAVTVVVLGLMSGGVWNDIKGRDSVPAEALPYRVMARQFEWHVTHPGPDGTLDTPDDFYTTDDLYVEHDKAYHFELRSRDVIHDFSVPAFRLKQDAIPGRTITGWFRPTLPGSYDIQCAEICGIGHGVMNGRIHIETAAAHQAWVQEHTPVAAAEPGTP